MTAQTARPTRKEMQQQTADLGWNAARILYLEWFLTDPKLKDAKRPAIEAELAVYRNAGSKPWPVLAAEVVAARKAAGSKI